MSDEDEDSLEEAAPSPAAEAFAEWGRALNEVWDPPRRRGGIAAHEVAARRRRRGATAEVRETSMNRKLSPVVLDRDVEGIARPHALPPYCSSTFAAIGPTCPSSCPFKGNGCMADSGFTRILSVRLNDNARGMSELQVIAEEACEIDGAFDGGPIPHDGLGRPRALRLHVGGDVQSVECARILGAAAVRWRKRGGGSVWTFTHSWRTIPREAWGWAVSVLASVETAADLELALARGYAPAIVVPELPLDGKRMKVEGSKVPVIPCPGETRAATCVGCRLCLDRPLVKMGAGIAFGVHGRDRARAAAALVQLGGPRR